MGKSVTLRSFIRTDESIQGLGPPPAAAGTLAVTRNVPGVTPGNENVPSADTVAGPAPCPSPATDVSEARTFEKAGGVVVLASNCARPVSVIAGCNCRFTDNGAPATVMSACAQNFTGLSGWTG